MQNRNVESALTILQKLATSFSPRPLPAPTQRVQAAALRRGGTLCVCQRPSRSDPRFDRCLNAGMAVAAGVTELGCNSYWRYRDCS